MEIGDVVVDHFYGLGFIEDLAVDHYKNISV